MSKSCRVATFFISLCIFAVANLPCFAATDAKKNVKEANRFYKQGKLDEALQKYNDASVALPDSDIVNFNMGTALYKKEDYEKAQDAFTKALTSEDKKLEADALYNLGNCKYKLGKLKENTDLSTTVALLRESLDYYKRAIDLDQKNTDARFNHEFVERELKVLLDKLKQQQSNTDKQKEQEQQQEEQKQGTCPTGKEQGKEDKEKEGSAQEKEQKQQEKEGQEGQSQQEEQAAAEETQQEEQGKELSEEGARALLERYGQEETTPNYEDRRTGAYDREVSKDW
ncbi:MAG: tetratricopeptide repeat protein [Candidatus Omnitrophota bacterium]|jgi:Ca-activated chloride channel family protein|nr:MAG: tetratricopeptide repeat protein [Candidatus Omnitrophota bacterium]